MEKTNIIAKVGDIKVLVMQANLHNADTAVPHITKRTFDRIFWAVHKALPGHPCGFQVKLFLEDGRQVHYSGTNKCFIW